MGAEAAKQQLQSTDRKVRPVASSGVILFLLMLQKNLFPEKPYIGVKGVCYIMVEFLEEEIWPVHDISVGTSSLLQGCPCLLVYQSDCYR